MAERLANDEQKQVINEMEQNILLFASAGTGKTFSVARRVQHILESKVSKPDEILCITFTVKASREMKDDILEYAGDDGKEVFVTTIHGFCYQFLREQAKKSGAQYSDPQVFDEVDADTTCKEALQLCGFDNEDVKESNGVLYNIVSLLKKEREMNGPYTQNEANDYQTVLCHIYEKDANLIKEKMRFWHKSKRNFDFNTLLYDFLLRNAGNWMKCYCDLLRKDNALDYEDLICHVHRAMKNREIQKEYQSRYKYIIVDEMQDTSIMEYDIIRILFQGNHSMMCGDFFQTIYEWRGTNPQIILSNYINEFQPIQIVFTHNYRATRKLCEASFGYLKNAFKDEIKDYIPPTICIESEQEGSKILHIKTAGVEQEAQLITRYLEKSNPADPSRICVLSRTNRQIANLYTQLMHEKKKNPHDFRFFTVDEEKRFSCKAVIKDVLAFPRVLLSERTDETSLTRICKKAAHGIGDRTIEAIKGSGTIGLSLSSFIKTETYVSNDPYFILIQSAGKQGIVIYDTETTGNDPEKDQIIQIAAIRMDADGKVIGKLNHLVKHTVPISKGALATHHITEKEISEKGIETKDALLDFCRFVDGMVIVGHNSVRFDYPLIQRQLKECGLPEMRILGHYDTMLIAKQFLPDSKNYKLATLCERFGIVNEKAHDAYWDIQVTGELLFHLIHDYILVTENERKQMIDKYKKRFEPVMRQFDDLDSNYLHKGDIQGFIQQVIRIYGYENCERESDRQALDELNEYIQSMPKSLDATPLRSFLSDLSLSGSQMDTLIQRMKKIPIITVHQSKGCEFDTVIIADAVEGVFPHSISVKEGREKEERRLFYVALSRAKKNLIIISPLHGGYQPAAISRYLGYIPEEYIDHKEWKL